MTTQVVKGIHLPVDDTHFTTHFEKGPLFNGRGTYQYSKIEAALAVCKSRHVALDIGAHVGLWTMVLAEHFKRVIAFEPVPAHIECFNKNIANLPAGGADSIKLFECALGRMNDNVYIETVAGNSGNSRVSSRGYVTSMFMLDSMMHGVEDIDFIKIDVEGFEMQVVQGGEQTIRRHRPVMVVEQKPGHAEKMGHKTGAVIDLLRQWGYKEAWVRAGDHCMIP